MAEQTRRNAATDDGGSGLLSQLPVDRLRDEAVGFGRAFGKRSLNRLGSGVEGITERLSGFVDGIPLKNEAKQSKGDSSVKAGAKAAVDKVAAPVGKVTNTAAAQVKGTAAQVKDTVGHIAGGLGKSGQHRGEGEQPSGRSEQPSGKKVKVTNIVEAIDVPVSRDVAYEQWTQFEEFPSFMKKVENVTQEENEVITWQAQVFWSHRTWKATILDQVPNEHIVWKSQSKKGYVDGAVTFHELAPNLTRILVSLEYHPKGIFEHTGNLWRAQGRRVRLEMKHFRRHVANHTLLHRDEIEGWTGEIHDKQVIENDADEGAENGEKSSQEKTSQGQGRKAPARTSRSSEKSSRSESSGDGAPSNEAPTKKTAARKTAAKTTAAKSTPAKKTAAKTTAAKKTPAKRTPSKQSATKQSPRKQSASRRTSSRSSQGA